MTYCPDDDNESATGRRIEITADMIEAGENAFARFDPDFDPYAVGVAKVVRAVLERGGYEVRET